MPNINSLNRFFEPTFENKYFAVGSVTLAALITGVAMAAILNLAPTLTLFHSFTLTAGATFLGSTLFAYGFLHLLNAFANAFANKVEETCQSQPFINRRPKDGNDVSCGNWFITNDKL